MKDKLQDIKLRYAKGEITRREFDKAKQELLSEKKNHQIKPSIKKEIKAFETKLKKEEKIYFGRFKLRFFLVIGGVMAVLLIIFLLVQNSTISKVSSPALNNVETAIASGKNSAYIPVSVTSQLGTSMSGITVEASTNSGSVSGCTTDNSGGCNIIFTAPKQAISSYADITITVGSITKQISVKVNPDQTASLNINLVQSSIQADGISGTVVTINAYDNQSAQVPDGTSISLSINPVGGGSLSQQSCTTLNGSCQVTYTSSTSTGSVTIIAQSYSTEASTSLTLQALPPSVISLSSSGSSINADGKSTATITAKVTNKINNPVSNQAIQFYANLGSVTYSCTTDSSGTCSITYTAPNQAGTAQVTGSIGSLTSSTSIILVPVANIQAQFYTTPYIGNPITPAFAINTGYLQQNMTTISLTNTGSGTFQGTVTLTIPGWSSPVSKLVTIPSQSTITIYMNPPLNSQAFSNNQEQAVNYQLTITDSNGKQVYQNSYPANITSYNTMDWFGGKYTNLIASWVTPGVSAIQNLVSASANYTPGHAILGGYEQRYSYSYPCGFLDLSTCYGAYSEQQSVNLQIQAIYDQLQAEGVHYVNAPSSFSGSQTVYTPIQSLSKNGANCIDGTVTFASALESTGIHAYIALVPGHAFVCASTVSNDTSIQCVETTMVGSNANFTQAENYADSEYNQYNNQGQLTLVNVNQLLNSGVKSLPG